MRALILSDNHHRKLEIDTTKYDYVFHAGDHGQCGSYLKKLGAIYVRGNCDIDGAKEEIRKIDGIKIFLTHGDYYNVKMDYNRLIYKAMSLECKLVIFGHTHHQSYFIEEGITFINPGAYKDSCYAEIIDNDIIFYNNGSKVVKKLSM